MARNEQPGAASGPAQGGPAPGTTVAAGVLQSYRERLQAELDELTVQAEELEQAANANTPEGSGEVAFDEEFTDAGSYTFERERDLSLSNNARDLIDKIQHALTRMDRGTFGRCETCGSPIEPERLDALPYATLCLADARRQVRLR